MSLRNPWSNCAYLGMWPLLGNLGCSCCAACALAAPFLLVAWVVWRCLK